MLTPLAFVSYAAFLLWVGLLWCVWRGLLAMLTEAMERME